MENIDKRKNCHRLNPTRVVILGFFAVICIGTFLLNLPIASNDGESIGIVNALFTATSAVCVTGLVVVDTLSHWTIFGKIVIICLIQIGGLGFMTVITMFFIMRKRKITLKERMVIQESLNQDTMAGMVKLVKNILKCTLIVESVGALLLSIHFVSDFGFLKGVAMGCFHSISAFCNAGFDIIGPTSLAPYVSDVYINVIIMSLIVIGGLGFTVWIDMIKVIRLKFKNRLNFKSILSKLSLHSKVVLLFTPILILGGAIFVFIFEYENPETLGNLGMTGKITASFMQSVTLRTAGFYSISQSGMTYASKFLSILLMFVGGSPAGTAGGIKTTTMAILIITVMSVARGSITTNIWGRKIPFGLIQKALSVFLISLTAVIGVTMLLTITEKGMAIEYEFIDLLFETASALGTVGITTGITPYLSTIGKIIISVAMFMGRIGPISIIIGLARKQNSYVEHVQYPEESVMVG